MLKRRVVGVLLPCVALTVAFACEDSSGDFGEEIVAAGAVGQSAGGEMCAETDEGGSLTLWCSGGARIESIAFASYGLPKGTCGSGFELSACHSASSVPEVEDACLNRMACSVKARNGVFGDPCGGKVKKLVVVYTCSGGTLDRCPSDPLKTAPGICGCGVADADSDKDGTPDCKDGCPKDSSKTKPGDCGCGVPEGTCGGGDPVSQDLVLTPVADAYVDSVNAGTNYGSKGTLLVDNAPNVYKSLLRFRVPVLTADLESAKLRLFVTNDTGNGPKVYMSKSGWTESGVTFKNCPGPQGSAIADIGSLPKGWVEIDVTKAIKGGGDYSFLLSPDDNNGADFDSKEGSNKPQLLIVTRGQDEPTIPSGGDITHVGTTETWDKDGIGMSIARPSGTRAGDLLILIMHRTDDDLPLYVDGWTRVAECYKRDNKYDCSTEEDCVRWHNDDYCRNFGTGGEGHDLAQSIFYKKASSSEPSSYRFTLKSFRTDKPNHPAWIILTALRGAATVDPVREWANVGYDSSPDSIFPSVYGVEGDMLLLSQSFDDPVAQSLFGAPSGTTTFGYVSGNDESGFLYGKVLTQTGQTGTMRTNGVGSFAGKDALVSLTIKPL